MGRNYGPVSIEYLCFDIVSSLTPGRADKLKTGRSPYIDDYLYEIFEYRRFN